MSPLRLVTPFRRDLVLVLVALGLVVAPLWVPHLVSAEPTYQYERAEVTANETTVEYADDVHGQIAFGTPISDEIACSRSWVARPCALERLLLDDATVPSGMYSSSPGPTSLPNSDPYRYVRINDTIYDPVYVANESAEGENGMYRVDLNLERADPEAALRDVSVAVTSDDLHPAVAEAARDGDGRASRDVDVPETPIRLEDGTYYRVYRTSHSEPSLTERNLGFAMTYFAPLLGLGALGHLSRRFEVTYVG